MKTVIEIEDGKITVDGNIVKQGNPQARKDEPAPPFVPGVSSGPASATVAWVDGGTVSTPYPQGNQKMWLVTGAAPGTCTFDLGNIAATPQRYPGVFNFAEAGGADPVAAIAVSASGREVISYPDAIGPRIVFDIGTAPGQVPPGPAQVVVKLSSTSNGQFYFQQQAHDRGGN